MILEEYKLYLKDAEKALRNKYLQRVPITYKSAIFCLAGKTLLYP